MADATVLAYALIVLLGVLIIISVLQIVQTAHALRRQRAGQATAPKDALVFLATAVVSLALSHIFDVSVVGLRLLQGSQTPPPSDAHLALAVVTTVLGQAFAPTAIYASWNIIMNNRIELSGLEDKDASSVRWRKWVQLRARLLLVAFPVIMIAYLGLFSKAVLDTPTLARVYYSWISISKYFYRAAVFLHALLFLELASRTISFHLLSKSHSYRDSVGVTLNLPLHPFHTSYRSCEGPFCIISHLACLPELLPSSSSLLSPPTILPQRPRLLPPQSFLPSHFFWACRQPWLPKASLAGR